MNLIKSLVVLGLVFSGSQAFAHKGKNPCKQYWESCKDTKGKTEKKECVKAAAEADTTNGPACTASMEKHKEHHQAKKDAAAAGDASPSTN